MTFDAHLEAYHVESHWGPREESAAACAVHLARMLEGLAAAHPIFARWNKKGYTRKQADAPFCTMPPRIDELTKIFERALTHKDSPRVPWPELGYRVSAWNGIDGVRGASFKVKSGAFAETPFFPNSVDVDLPWRVPDTTDITMVSGMRSLLLSVIAAWDPAWAGLYSSRNRQRLHKARSEEFPRFRADWMTYLSAPYAARVSAPRTAIVEEVPGGGLLMLATAETFTIENPAHVAAADEIQTALEPLQSLSKPL